MPEALQLMSVAALGKEFRKSAADLTAGQARKLVDAYYQIQDYRIQAAAQVREDKKAEAQHDILVWLYRQMDLVEEEIRKALDVYAKSHEASVWALSICGIGPVLAAGLQAHINPERVVTAGDIWAFAGLDPTREWKEGEKRPFNAKLKVLAWKIGESFIMQQNKEKDVYGKVYAERKRLEIEKNEIGGFAEQAKTLLKKKKFRKETEAYKHYIIGKLPPAHIHARARRYATKLFLAHYAQVVYEVHHKKPAPKPYIIEHGGHVHFIGPPNYMALSSQIPG